MRGTVLVAASVAALTISGCGDGGSAASPPVTVTAPVTVTKTAATQAPAPAGTTVESSAQITIPEVEGQNAEIVQDKLEKLGLTNVELASANPKYSMVLKVANWTAVSIEPAPGTMVGAGDTVVLKVTKP